MNTREDMAQIFDVLMAGVARGGTAAELVQMLDLAAEMMRDGHERGELAVFAATGAVLGAAKAAGDGAHIERCVQIAEKFQAATRACAMALLSELRAAVAP